MPPTREDLPDEIRRFVLTSIPSVPFLEALLLLRGAPTRAWSVQDVAKALYTNRRTAEPILLELADAGIASGDEKAGFTWAPETPELAALLEELARAYATHLVAVTDLIHSRTERRAQQFADAFRIGRKKEER